MIDSKDRAEEARTRRKAESAAIVEGLQTTLEGDEQLLGFTRGRLAGGLRGKLMLGPDAFFAPYVNVGLTERRVILQHIHPENGRPSEILPHFFPIGDVHNITFSDIETFGSESAGRLVVQLPNEQSFRVRFASDAHTDSARSLVDVYRSMSAVRRRKPTSPTQSTCGTCGHILDEPVKFCPYCGAKQDTSVTQTSDSDCPELDVERVVFRVEADLADPVTSSFDEEIERFAAEGGAPVAVAPHVEPAPTVVSTDDAETADEIHRFTEEGGASAAVNLDDLVDPDPNTQHPTPNALPEEHIRPWKHPSHSRRRPAFASQGSTVPRSSIRPTAPRWRRFAERPDFDRLLKWLSDLGAERFLRIMFTADSIRVSPRQCSRLYNDLREACSILDVKEPEFYLSQYPFPNAFAFGMQRNTVVITTSLIDLLSDDERLYVIGHELGHIKAEHMLYRTMAIVLAEFMQQAVSGLAIPGAILTGALAYALFAWFRRSEFTCDRAGLLTVQDPEICVSSILKLVGGSQRLVDDLRPDEFTRQADLYEDMDEDMLSLYYKFLMVRWQTHPFPAVRARDLNEWSQTDAYLRLLRGDYPRKDPSAGRRTCAACGTVVTNVSYRFCPECGDPLGPVAST